MKLSVFIKQLQDIEKYQQENNLGDLPVFYRHGASGDCGELSTAHVTRHVESSGPFDLPGDGWYVSVYAGN